MKDISSNWGKELQKILNKFDTIVLFRHEAPDFDALGTQFGLYTWLNDNYSAKKIYALGENHKTMTNRLFPAADIVSDEILFSKPFLAIILDSGDCKRISDKRFAKAEFILKIDHHPVVDQYGTLNLVDTTSSSTAQIVGEIITAKCFKKQKLTAEAAKYLFIGIVGDSGRFQYSSTSEKTFAVSSKLLKTKFDLQKDIYLPMYRKSSEELKISAYILSNFKMSKHGVAYYYLDNKFLEKYNLTPERGKENINLFSNVEDIHIWVSFSEDKDANSWRVSIRSREVAVNQIAVAHRGGGHKNAAGATAKDIDETLAIIEELDDLLD